METFLNDVEQVSTDNVIKITLNIGSGENENDPVKKVVQYWTLDGKYIGGFIL